MTPTYSNYSRKMRTRTLIQLGGLIEKSGLLEKLEITMGADLQKDEDLLGSVTTLLGALVELKSHIDEDSSIRKIWELKGKQAYGG